MALLTFQAKDNYEREQRKKEWRKETGEDTWMLPSLSKILTEEAVSDEKVSLNLRLAHLRGLVSVTLQGTFSCKQSLGLVPLCTPCVQFVAGSSPCNKSLQLVRSFVPTFMSYLIISQNDDCFLNEDYMYNKDILSEQSTKTFLSEQSTHVKVVVLWLNGKKEVRVPD